MNSRTLPLFFAIGLTALIQAHGQDVAKTNSPIQLKIQGAAPTYLSQNSNDYATVGQSKADYTFHKVDAHSSQQNLKHGDQYIIKHKGKYLYETAKGNAGFTDAIPGEKSESRKQYYWTVEKQVTESSNKDKDSIQHGDVIQLSNGYWKDNYLCDYGTGYAAAGPYNKPRNWVVEFELPEAKVGPPTEKRETIESVAFISNLGAPASVAAEVTMSLSASDQMGIKTGDSTHYELGIKIGGEVGGAGGKLTAEASAAFGRAWNKEKERVNNLTQGKSINIKYDKPANAECFVYTRMTATLLYRNVGFGDATMQMKGLSGALELTSSETMVIGPGVTPVSKVEVEEYLEVLAARDKALADRLRTKRLPEWLKNGWVK